MRLHRFVLALFVLFAPACKTYVTATADAVAIVNTDTTKKSPPDTVVKMDTVTTTVVVSPKTLNLLIGQSAGLSATVTVSSGTTPTPTWTKSNNCVTLSATTGTTITVNAVSACNVYVIASANGVRDSALVNVTAVGTVFPPTTLNVCGPGYTGTTTYQIHTFRNGVELRGPSQVQYYVNGKVSVEPNSGLVTPIALGIDTVRVAPVASPNDIDTYVFTVVNTGCQYSLPQGPYTIGSGQSCTNNTLQLTSSVAGTWASGNPSLATVTPSGLVTAVSNANGTVSMMFTPSNGGSPQSVNVTVTNTSCVPSVITTVVVSPKVLPLLLSQSANLSATVTVSNGTAPTPTWSRTNSCISLSATAGVTTSVLANAVCNTYVVASANGVRDSSLVNVTSGASSCTWANASGSSVYNAYIVGAAFNATGNCVYHGVVQQPYWYSKDPSRFGVLGAPFVCMIAGVGYPCGTSATIKPIFTGTTDICDQAAVQDPNVFFCRTLTAVAGLSASMIQGGIAEGYSMILPTAPPKGAKVDRVYAWGDWVAMHK